MQSPPLAATVEVLADALVAELPAGADLVVPIANGEPVRLLAALEARADRLRDVRVHQMHTLRDRAYLHGEYAGRLEHVSWFLSPVTRPAYHAGTCEFAPANFSEVPQFLLAKRPHAVLAAASPMDRHGYFSLGVCADYAAAMIGRVPFILEVNPNMPSTHGANRLHHSEVQGWYEAEIDLVEVPPAGINPVDDAIADHIADRIPDGATIQLGIGAIPSAVASRLADHRDPGAHPARSNFQVPRCGRQGFRYTSSFQRLSHSITSPLSVKATTLGVSRFPSALGITFTSEPSIMATTELVVPRSMPMIFSP